MNTPSARRAQLLLALEPRMMFDGAVATTVADAGTATHDATHPDASVTQTANTPSPTSTATTTSGHQVVFIENDVANYQSLIAQLPASDQVVVLDSKSDGLAQIAQWASTHQGYSAIHIISHGESNDLMLGTLSLSQANVASRQADLATIGQALQPGGDILLYGCDIGAGSQGEAFVQSLAQASHADVAASTDATGSSSRGGDWTLERSSGHIDVTSLDLAYDGLLARPNNGISSFDSASFTTVSGSSTGSGLTASNVDGWDVTLHSAAATNCYISTEALTQQTALIDGASVDGVPLGYLQFKSNDGSLFTLTSVDLAMSGASNGSSGTLQLIGYRNGVAVSGAVMSLSVTDANYGGQLVTFDVSNNSNFQGIDSFRVQTDGSYQVIGAFGVDNINATNFHFPGPILTASGGSSAYSSGNGNAVVVDSGLTLTDTTSTTQTSATVSITGNYHSGEDLLAFSNTSASTYGNISASFNSATGTLTLTSSGSTATTAQWQAALRAVTYQDSSLSPNTSSRTLSIVITDAANNTSSAVSKTVTVAADQAPVISNLHGDSASFTVGDSAVHLDAGTAVSVTDSDTTSFSGGSLTVHLSANGQSADVLGIDSSGSVALSTGTSVGSTISVGGVAIGTIASNGDGVSGHDLTINFNSSATASRVTSLVGALSFSTSSASTATRTVQVTVNDGRGQTSSASSVSVAVINAPILTPSAGSTAFVAGDNVSSTPVVVDSGLTLTDPGSATLASVTVRISNNFQSGQDALSFSNNGSSMGNIAVSYNAATGSMTLTSSGATATLAQWQTALRSIIYSNNAITPNTATRTLSFEATDGNGNTSSTVTRSITVSATDQTPIITGSGGSVAFVAGDNAISTPVVVDSGLTLSDRDNSTLAGATVAISNNLHGGEDLLTFTNSSATVYGNITANYNAGSGVLTLSSSGATATLAQWQAALRSVTYRNSAVTPDTTTRTISFAVSDGTKTSSTVTRSVTMAATDQTPVITSSGGSAAFVAGDNTSSTPVVIDSGLTVSDLDNTTLSSAMVSISGNFHASEDLLTFTNSSATTYGNITANYNSGSGTLTLTSSGATATLAQWQAALRSITYRNSAVTPNSATRTISFIIIDGIKASATVTRSVTVAATDQTPLINGSGGNVSYAIGTSSGPLAIDSGLTVSDLDNSTLARATVSISNNFQSGEDRLAFSNTSAVTYGNIAASFNSGTGALTLSSSGATATLAQWQAALRAVTYDNTAGTPNSATRSVSFVVNDGSKDSSVAVRQVSLQLPTPSISGLSTASDSGASHSDGITRDNQPTITGSALANSTVTVYLDGVAVGMTTADGSGVWQYTMPSPLSDGNHALRAQISNSGNSSAQSASHSITIDSTAPQIASAAPQQATSAGASSLRFNVLINEPASNLDMSAISLVGTGSASGTITSVERIDATHYTVLVSAVSGQGSLAISLGAGAVTDIAGNSSSAILVSSACQLTAASSTSDPVLLPPAQNTNVAPTATPPAPMTIAPISPNVVLAALNTGGPAVTAPLSTALALGSATSPFSTPAFGQDHFANDNHTPGNNAFSSATQTTAPAGSPFVTLQTIGSGPALQVRPDIGIQVMTPGQPLNISLPRDAVISRDPGARISISAIQSNGQPLPGWLRFDPQTGRFSGTPPAGWNRSLSLEIRVLDSNGHRGVIHLRLGAQARTADAAPLPAGKQPLNEQFRQHDAGLATRLAHWLTR